eukprot:g70445.t1
MARFPERKDGSSSVDENMKPSQPKQKVGAARKKYSKPALNSQKPGKVSKSGEFRTPPATPHGPGPLKTAPQAKHFVVSKAAARKDVSKESKKKTVDPAYLIAPIDRKSAVVKDIARREAASARKSELQKAKLQDLQAHKTRAMEAQESHHRTSEEREKRKRKQWQEKDKRLAAVEAKKEKEIRAPLFSRVMSEVNKKQIVARIRRDLTQKEIVAEAEKAERLRKAKAQDMSVLKLLDAQVKLEDLKNTCEEAKLIASKKREEKKRELERMAKESEAKRRKAAALRRARDELKKQQKLQSESAVLARKEAFRKGREEEEKEDMELEVQRKEIKQKQRDNLKLLVEGEKRPLSVWGPKPKPVSNALAAKTLKCYSEDAKLARAIMGEERRKQAEKSVEQRQAVEAQIREKKAKQDAKRRQQLKLKEEKEEEQRRKLLQARWSDTNSRTTKPKGDMEMKAKRLEAEQARKKRQEACEAEAQRRLGQDLHEREARRKKAEKAMKERAKEQEKQRVASLKKSSPLTRQVDVREVKPVACLDISLYKKELALPNKAK